MTANTLPEAGGVQTTRIRYYFWIMGVIIVALALRLWSSDFGLPYGYHIDELDYNVAAINLACDGQLNTPLLQSQTYIFGTALSISKLLPANFTCDPSNSDPTSYTLLVGRLISVAFGTATVFAIYLLGKSLYNEPVGILAALFSAFNFLHVRESHFGTPDIVSLFVCICALTSYVRVYKNRTLGNYILAGILTTLAINGRITYGLLIIPLAYVHFLPVFTAEKFSWPALKDSIFNATVFKVALVMIVLYVLVNPKLLIDPIGYLRYWRIFLKLGSQGGFGDFVMDPFPAPVFYAQSAVWGAGILQAIMMLVGMVWALWKHKYQDLFLLSFLFFYFALAITSHIYFARYILAILLPLTILAARFIWEVILRSGAIRWLAVLIPVILIQPLLSIVQFNSLLGQTDTRTIAYNWIMENIPKDAKIEHEYYTPDLNEYPNAIRSEVFGVWLTDLNTYKAEGFDYLIVSSYVEDLRMLSAEQETHKEMFYQQLEQTAELVMDFKPYNGPSEPAFRMDQLFGPITSMNDLERPGPTIRIFRLPK